MTRLSSPRSCDELRRIAPSGRILAGGTDLLVQMRAGRQEHHLVDISNLTDAPVPVRASDGVLEVSAIAPISHVISTLAGRLPGLAAAAGLFGSIQIRNRATIGGNLANASPAADAVPPLVAAGATAVIEGPAGAREIGVAGLAMGPGRTVLLPGEWISVLKVPLPPGREGFRKLGGRSAMAISIANLAWRWTVRDSALTGVRLAAGAVAATVTRCTDAEDELEGRRPSEAVVSRAVSALRAAVAPIDDVRASRRYRSEALAGLLREALLLHAGADAA